MAVKIIVMGAAILLLLFIAATIYFFWYSFIRWKPKYKGDYDDQPDRQFAPFREEILAGKKWMHDHRNDRIVLTARDGIHLVGYYIPARQSSNKTVLFMHGYRADAYGDFSCLAEFYHDSGYNILIAHQRAHGESEGKYIGFGVLERFDCKQWIEYLNERFGTEQSIYLAGVSMGCATVLMALGLSLPANVKGVIADCGFTRPWDIFVHVIKSEIHVPIFPFLYLEDFLCRKIIGYGLKECSTVDILKENEVPVLFIHGGADDFVPVWMGKANYEACKAKKQLLIIEEAQHANCSMQASERYQKTVLSFLES